MTQFNELLARSRVVGQDLLNRIDRADTFRKLSKTLSTAAKEATPLVTGARNSFYHLNKLFDDNVDHYVAFQQRLHAKLKALYGFEFEEEEVAKRIASFPLFGEHDETFKMTAAAANVGTLGSLAVIAAASGPVGWAFGGALLAGNQLTKGFRTKERWHRLIAGAVQMILMYDWCAWAKLKSVTSEVFFTAFILCVRRAQDILKSVDKNWDMVDAVFRLGLEETLVTITKRFQHKPERQSLSGLEWCVCRMCNRAEAS